MIWINGLSVWIALGAVIQIGDLARENNSISTPKIFQPESDVRIIGRKLKFSVTSDWTNLMWVIRLIFNEISCVFLSASQSSNTKSRYQLFWPHFWNKSANLTKMCDCTCSWCVDIEYCGRNVSVCCALWICHWHEPRKHQRSTDDDEGHRKRVRRRRIVSELRKHHKKSAIQRDVFKNTTINIINLPLVYSE